VTGLYAYAISRGLDADDLADARGIGDAHLRLVEHRGLCAVVSDVDLDEFGEEGLRRNLEDLGWLETVALGHDRVARHAAEHAPTAPLRLATVFLGEDSLRAQLDEWHDRAARALDRIDGRGEWGVKGYVDPSAAEPAATGPGDSGPGESGPGAGRAYLMQRRAAGRQRAEAAEQDAATAEQIHAALAEVAVAGRRLPAQDRRLTGHTGEMVLNGTYLVDEERVPAFRDTVDRLAQEHPRVRLEVGGPWPPYSFASLEES
jgi:hypothetical protein